MNWRQKDKLIEAIFNNKPIYIKNTGVRVNIEYYGSDNESPFLGRSSSRKNENIVKINFETTPNNKALKLCKNFNILRNGHHNRSEAQGNISLVNLSLVPFEGAAAKLIYEKEKKVK